MYLFTSNGYIVGNGISKSSSNLVSISHCANIIGKGMNLWTNIRADWAL